MNAEDIAQLPDGWTSVIQGSRTFYREGTPVVLTACSHGWVANMRVSLAVIDACGASPGDALRALANELRKAADSVEVIL